MDEIKYKGYWFVPSNVEQKCLGEVSYTKEDGIKLELYGTLAESDIILGVTDKGTPLTLCGCFVAQEKMATGFSTSVVVANVMLFGKHFYNETEMLFCEIGFSLTHLNTWMWGRNFEIQPGTKEKTYNIKYTYPKPVEASVGDKYKIVLAAITKPPTVSLVQNQVEIFEQYYVHIRSEQPQTLQDLFEQQYIFECFLDIATNLPQNVLDCFLMTSNKEKVGVYIQPLTWHEQKQASPMHLPFNFNQVSERWEDLISLWYERFEEYFDIYSLYFSSCRQRNVYPEQRFLHYAQFLESYHRRKFKKSYSDDDKKLKKEIIADADEKYKGFLQENLKLHEISFKERLIELCDTCHIIDRILKLDQQMKAYENVDAFTNDIKNNRNYYTHYDKTGKAKAYKGLELYYLAEKIEVVIRYFMLFELDFVDEEILEIMNRMYHFDRIEHIGKLDEAINSMMKA